MESQACKNHVVNIFFLEENYLILFSHIVVSIINWIYDEIHHYYENNRILRYSTLEVPNDFNIDGIKEIVYFNLRKYLQQ